MPSISKKNMLNLIIFWWYRNLVFRQTNIGEWKHKETWQCEREDQAYQIPSYLSGHSKMEITHSPGWWLVWLFMTFLFFLVGSGVLRPYTFANVKVVFRYDFDGISLLPRGGLTDAKSQVWSAGKTRRFGRFQWVWNQNARGFRAKSQVSLMNC